MAAHPSGCGRDLRPKSDGRSSIWPVGIASKGLTHAHRNPGQSLGGDRPLSRPHAAGAPIAFAAAIAFLAFAVGALLHKRLPEQFLHGIASVLFLLFGLWLLFDTALGLQWVAVGTATLRRSAAVPPRIRWRLSPLESSPDPERPLGWLLSVKRLTSFPRSARYRRHVPGSRPAALDAIRLRTQLANTRFRSAGSGRSCPW